MADASVLLPCPFCGNDGNGSVEDALHISHTENDWREHRDSYSVQCDKCTATMGYSDSQDEAIAAWNTRAAPPAMDREAVDRKFWLIIREPGRLPDRKGPWPLEQTASILREFMAANPNSFIDYLTIGPDGSPYVDHGPEVLQMTDGRSMSVGRKHNARVREAATAALSTLSADAIRQGEPFGYWVEQKLADPVLLRKPAYIPEPSDLRTVTPLYAAPVVAASLPQNVVHLVIAAREAFDTGILPQEEQTALDKAMEPFASSVPYANEPATPASHASDGGEA